MVWNNRVIMNSELGRMMKKEDVMFKGTAPAFSWRD
jgi:hypothetical protein